jgi:hypothetical protein
MNNELYKRTLYTKKVKFIINEIHEYDIAKANISILLQGGYITAQEYNMYLQMSKMQREIAIGNLQKNPEISRVISEGFEWARKCLIESNNLSEDDIVSIKKDAFYVMRRLQYTTFGNIEFTHRNSYHMYIYCRGIEIYYGMNELDDSGDILDIKGINDSKLELHSAYLSFLSYILKQVVKGNIVGAIQELMTFIQRYDNRQLDIEYYREFNSDSMYRLGHYGVMFIDDSYKNVLNISNNQMFNRELFSILMSIQYKR